MLIEKIQFALEQPRNPFQTMAAARMLKQFDFHIGPFEQPSQSTRLIVGL